MTWWMPTGLPALSSTRSISGSRTSTGLPSRSSYLHLGAAADDLLRRDAVDALDPRAHELHAAARDDEGLEAVGPQVGAAAPASAGRPARCSGRLNLGCRAVAIQSRTMASNSSVVLPACVAAMISSRPFSPLAATAFMSPSRTPLNGCVLLPLRVLGRQRLDPVKRERDLEVDRLLRPQRAVVVEGRDALGRRARSRARPAG